MLGWVFLFSPGAPSFHGFSSDFLPVLTRDKDPRERGTADAHQDGARRPRSRAPIAQSLPRSHGPFGL
jgi:hypothetical protein